MLKSDWLSLSIFVNRYRVAASDATIKAGFIFAKNNAYFSFFEINLKK